MDIRKIGDHVRNGHFARYVLTEMKSLSERHGFKLVLVMDAVRDAIYERRNPSDYEVGHLNQIAGELTAELGLPFMELQDAFQRDCKANGERFEFPV